MYVKHHVDLFRCSRKGGVQATAGLISDYSHLIYSYPTYRQNLFIKVRLLLSHHHLVYILRFSTCRFLLGLVCSA